ncbi:MAG TPA: GSCFA domain-containing protein [Bacteroidia bacterium]
MSIRYNLDFVPAQIQPAINYKDLLVFSGSCFSEHISARLSDLNFRVADSANGVVFNPLSMAETFMRALNHIDFNDNDLIHHNGLFHGKYHHGRYSGIRASDVLHKMNHDLSEFRQNLKSASHIFLTFGSAYAYFMDQEVLPVANCHKVPSDRFKKRLLTQEEMMLTWHEVVKELKSLNPKVNIVTTVSPVKHLKDGVVENSLSKSILIVLCHAMRSELDCQYFPAFELVQDDLRDYRFYEKDGAHPNSLAIEYVFERFKLVCLDEQSQAFASAVSEYKKMCAHKIINGDGEAYIKFMSSLEKKRDELNALYGIEL